MKLSPRTALAHAWYVANMGKPDTWTHEVPSIRKGYLGFATNAVKYLKTLGFEVAERRTQKVKRRRR